MRESSGCPVADPLRRMRGNPMGDWTMSDVAAVCREHGLRCSPPSGGGSHHATLLIAESGEGRVGIGTLVISRVGDKLYANRQIGDKKLTVAQQYEDPNIFCPVPAK